MKIKNSTLILILSAAASILAVGLFFYFLKVIENKNTHISSTLITLQEKLKEQENAQIFVEKVNEIKLLQESVNNYFVDSNKIDTFVSFLEEMGSITGSNISVKNIEVLESSQNRISFELSIGGTFEQVMRTVVLLENIPYQVSITKVYLNKDIKGIVEEKLLTEKVILKDTVSSAPTWQANISFNILSLN
jgi:hypothetical protein